MKKYLFILLLFPYFQLFAQSEKQVLKEFEKAKKTHSSESYTAFINKFPKSEYSKQAKLARTELDSIQPVVFTFLGNEKRNYYGNQAPAKLDTIWKIYLGEAVSPAYGQQKVWAGAGWTGQPLFVRERKEEYLIQGAFDCRLKKINAKTGAIVWQYLFDDILKASPTLWINNNADNKEDRYVIMQGSRLGALNTKASKYVTSYRAVSYMTGKELWKINVKSTDSYSRDVDGSCLVVNDTAYLAFENGLFTVWNPDYKKCEMRDSMLQPKIIQELKIYNADDLKAHGDDICPEASPTLFNNHIYTPSGTGKIYAYNLKTKKNDWEFYIGTDLNGSLPLTSDSCLLVAVEKQYMAGPGGVFKLNPQKPEKDAVVWYYPTEDKKWYHWDGGLINSVAVNDAYVGEKDLHIAAFIDVAGYLTIVDHQRIDPYLHATAPDGKTIYPCPKILAKYPLEGSIATPIIVKDKLIAATDKGLFLFQIDYKEDRIHLNLLDKASIGIDFDATPIAVDGKIYITGRNGFMYCFGEK